MLCFSYFFFLADDCIRYLVRSRVLGDVYKKQVYGGAHCRDVLDDVCPNNCGGHGRCNVVAEPALSLIHT